MSERASPPPAIEVRDLVVSYGDRRALDGVSLSGPPRAVIGLLEAYTGGYVGHGLNLVIPFVVLIVILMVRPYGLFGRPVIERV